MSTTEPVLRDLLDSTLKRRLEDSDSLISNYLPAFNDYTKRTAAEIAAGVTPSNYSYPVGDVRRYGAVGDFVTDDTAALQRWINVAQQGVQCYLPATNGPGYRISTALTITSALKIYGDGLQRAAIICTASDCFQINGGVSQVHIEALRMNFVPRYQEIGGAITVNAYAGIRMFGSDPGPKCSNHTYRDVLIDGFLTGMVADGLQFSTIDNCGTTCGKNGILSAVFPANVNILGGVYQCGDLTNAGTLTGSIGIQFGDGATASQGCVIGDGCIITGFATNVWLFGANFCKVLDSFLDFTNGVAVLMQSGTNAATNNDIINNYIAMTALGTTGIRCLSNFPSSSPVGNRIHDNVMIMYAAGASRGILVDGTNELYNSIKNNNVNVGSTADCDIQTGSGHTVTGNSWLGTGFLSSVRCIYRNNGGTTLSNPYTFVVRDKVGNCTFPVTYSASMTIDATTGDTFEITATNGVAFTINAPTNPTDQQRISIVIRNTSGGALGAVTWNAVFKMSAWTQPATGFSRSIEFEYRGGSNAWIQRSQTGVDVPN